MLSYPWVYLLFPLAGLVIAFAAVWGHLRFWVARLSLPLPYAVEEVLQTQDGARIELRRVPRPGDGATRSGLPPVLLVHGLAANHRNQDLHPDCSLARHLAASGRDVWLLTLRSGRALRWAERKQARFAAMTAGTSGRSSRGARKIRSTFCAIMELTSETCLAAEEAASV